MSELTPRQRLTERVASRFVAEGFNPKTSYPLAVLSVEAFYAQNEDSPHYALVCEEAIAIITDVMPPFVTHMRVAFEQVAAAMSHVTQAAQAVGPYADMAMRLKKAEETEPQPCFDSSGLPVNETVSPLDHEVRNRQGEPCIEDGCGAPAVAGSAFCADCMPDATQHSAILQVVTDDLARDAVIPPELLGTVESIDVIEITPREFHQAAAQTLRNLGCTYDDLKAMYLRGEFLTAQHRSAWFNFGNLLDMELLDRAIEQLHPEDRITGAPHHYIVNGDHSECGCGGHDPSCEIWNISVWNHKPTLCKIRRTNCSHYPRHTYGQPCAHEGHRAPVVGLTDAGEEVRGPVSDG